MANVMTPSEASAPTVGQAPTNVPQGSQMVPFRRAAGAVRTDVSVNDTGLTLSTGQQKLIHTVPGTGYMCWLDLIATISVTANASTVSVVYAEDGPWTALGPTTLDAGGGQTINLQNGYEAHLVNIYGGYLASNDAASSDTNIFTIAASGTGATAGNLVVRARLPLIIDEHSLRGIMGNQSRGTKYNLRSDLGASGDIFTTAPAPIAATSITRVYGYLPVPGDRDARGVPQEKVPRDYGIIHWITSAKNESNPGAGQVNHYVRNLQNAVRTFILVFRQGTTTSPRSAAETALSGAGATSITLKVGSDVIFNETFDERRRIMYQQYGGQDAPKGVLCYSFIQDREHQAGWEFGDTYLYLGDITEAQFIITYPSGYTANAANSLTIITDSLSIPDNVVI